MKPAELVNNLGILHWIIKSTEDNDLRESMLETIRTCQLMAMRFALDDLQEILNEAEETDERGR